MAGGTFKTRNKVRPGAYINVKGTEKANLPVSERGILVLPLKLDFGAKTNVVDYQSDFKKLYGHEIYDIELLSINEGLKGASKIIVYRLNDGGVKASANDENISVVAKYAGTLGNKLKIAVIETTENKFIVETFLDTELVDSQEVTTAAEVKNNDYVEFTVTNLVETAGLILSSGTDDTVANSDYTDFLTYIEKQKYNTIAFNIADTEATTLVPIIKNFIERQREDLGIKVQAVIPTSSVTVDYEGIIQVENGVKLLDETIIDKATITAYIGGLTAGADVATSNTYVQYEGAAEAYPQKTHEEIIACIESGKIVFNEDCKIETDINSLVTYGDGKISSMSKNRTIRVLDSICNDIKDVFHSKYIGKVNNDDDGRNLLKADIISYMQNLESLGAIEEFDVANDISVVADENNKDVIIVDVATKTIDSMEKLYMTINLI